MSATIEWAKDVIVAKYPTVVKDGGVDFSGDGKITGNEKLTDVNNNGSVKDYEDFYAYMSRNKAQIAQQIKFVGYQSRLSIDNFIHQFLHVESSVIKADLIKNTYKLINEVLVEVKKRLKPGMTPQQNLSLVYQILKEKGYKIGSNKEEKMGLLSTHVNNKEFDCDSSSLIVLTVGHELNWPVGLVLTERFSLSGPGHAFVRWVDGTITVNIDMDMVNSDQFYGQCFKTKKLAILSQAQLVSLAYSGSAAFDVTILGNKKRAIKRLDRAIKLNPQAYYLYFARAMVLAKIGNRVKAMADFDLAKRLISWPALFYHARGQVNAVLGLNQAALLDFQQVVKLEPARWEGYAALAEVYLVLNDKPKALKSYRLAIAKKPSLWQVYSAMGVLQASMGNFKKAAKSFARAIVIEPNNAQLHHNKAAAHYQLGQHKQAIECLNKALALDPNLMQSYGLRGEVFRKYPAYQKMLKRFKGLPQDLKFFLKRGKLRAQKFYDYDGALADFDRAIELNSQSATAHFYHSVANYKAGKLDEALRDLNQVLKLDPKHVKALLSRASLIGEKGRFKQALPDSVLAVKLEPRNGVARFIYGSFLAAIGKYKLALRNLTLALGLKHPNVPTEQIYMNRGMVQAKQGKFRLALKDFRRAYKLNPKLKEARLAVLQAMFELKDFRGIIGLITKYLQKNPHDSDAYFGRARARLKLKDYVGAAKDFKQAHVLNPKNMSACEASFTSISAGQQSAPQSPKQQPLPGNPSK